MYISNNDLRKMENILHRGVLLPLQEMALRRVVASFWIDVLLSIKMNENISLSILDNYEFNVKEKASKVLPVLLKERMMNIVRPLGSTILNWIMYHKQNFNEIPEDFNLHTLKQLHWTCKGSIDYKKTAEKIIHLEMFSVEMHYKLACLHCLEDDIPVLWGKLSKNSKKYLHKEIQVGHGMQLEHYWAFLLNGKEYKLDIALKKHFPVFLSFQQFAFQLSVFRGNKAAIEYFFQKLTNEERDLSLFDVFGPVIDALDYFFYAPFQFRMKNLPMVLNYLLSQMKPEMLALILNCYPCNILICFLDWQLQDLFVEVANVIWTFLPETKYAYLLTLMHENFLTSGYCPELFREFFERSPCNFRKVFVDYECKKSYFLRKFFNMQDSDSIRVIFRNVDAPDSVRLVFSKPVFELMCKFIPTDKWHMVEVCLQEAMLSKEDRQRLEKDVLKFMATTDGGALVKETARKRKRSRELIGETYTESPGETSSDDEMLSRVKKLCRGKKANESELESSVRYVVH